MLTVKIIETALENKNFDFFEDIYDDISDYCNICGIDYPPMTWGEVEDYLDSLSPVESFNLGRNSKITLNDDIYTFDGYGNLTSYPTTLTYFRFNVCDIEDFVNFVNEVNR